MIERREGVKRRFVKVAGAEGLEPIISRLRRPMPVQLDYAPWMWCGMRESNPQGRSLRDFNTRVYCQYHQSRKQKKKILTCAHTYAIRRVRLTIHDFVLSFFLSTSLLKGLQPDEVFSGTHKCGAVRILNWNRVVESNHLCIHDTLKVNAVFRL